MRSLPPFMPGRYRVLMFDRVALARTGAGAIRRPALVALGLRSDGLRRSSIFRLAASESAAEWERFRRRPDPPQPDRRRARDDQRVDGGGACLPPRQLPIRV